MRDIWGGDLLLHSLFESGLPMRQIMAVITCVSPSRSFSKGPIESSRVGILRSCDGRLMWRFA